MFLMLWDEHKSTKVSTQVPPADVLSIMTKQNEITTMPMQQQNLSSLPKGEMLVFDGERQQNCTFMRVFFNTTTRKNQMTLNTVPLRAIRQVATKRAHQKLSTNASHRGFSKAKALFEEHFDDKQRITHAYLDKTIGWLNTKSEDFTALQLTVCFFKYAVTQRMNCSAYQSHMPSNMQTVIKKLPYKLREKWWTVACEFQGKKIVEEHVLPHMWTSLSIRSRL